jgi:hypothetical protein
MRGERVGYGIAHVAVEVHVDHRDVEALRVNQGERPIDRGGSGHQLTSAIHQHVFNEHEDYHFILDHEDAPTGK